MPKPNAVFKQTYQNYLKEIHALDIGDISPRIGVIQQDKNVIIPFLDKNYIISEHGFHDHSKESAPYDLCIVLCKYILMCPENEPHKDNLVSFRDFKDSGPLTVYFSNEVEQKIATTFAGRANDLIYAGKIIGGYSPDIDAGYDVAIGFNPLPKVPIVLVFNDQDDEFDAQANLLFEQRAEQYLDAECLAILGNILYQALVGSAPKLLDLLLSKYPVF